MATERGEDKTNAVNNETSKRLCGIWPKGTAVVYLLRFVAFLAAASATVVMALDKQTKSFVVATIGTTPVKATITAKFHDTPAFVFFIIVNGMGALHNLLMLVLEVFGNKFDLKGLRYVIVPILDMMILGLVSAGAGGAFFMGELGRNGNSHTRWNKTCDKFNTFCNHALWAFVASFVGLLLLMTINMISILKLRSPKVASGYSSLP